MTESGKVNRILLKPSIAVTIAWGECILSLYIASVCKQHKWYSSLHQWFKDHGWWIQRLDERRANSKLAGQELQIENYCKDAWGNSPDSSNEFMDTGAEFKFVISEKTVCAIR